MLSKSQIKYIQSLGQKKFRDEQGVFIAEGSKIVFELLTSQRAKITHLYGLKEWIEENKQHCYGINTEEITAGELKKISQLSTPRDVLVVVKKIKWHEEIAAPGRITLVLDGIQDPGNMGTIIRIADWFGITQIVCSRECADIYNPKVVQATMGSIARVRTEYTSLPDWLKKNNRFKIVATALEGRPVNTIKKMKEGIVVIGNESRGINPEIMALCNEKITVPRLGGAESLNAAVACGIILSHLTGNE